MLLRAAIVSPFSVTLAACSTMETVELDEYALTTANGVRFRVGSTIDGACAWSSYQHYVGWGLFPSTVEQSGKVRRNPKFNFARPGDDLNSVAVRRAPNILGDFYEDARLACALWEVAPQELKQSHLTYYQDAIKGFFEAATRFEAAAKIGPEALLVEEDAMRDKFAELKPRRPNTLSRRTCIQTRVTVVFHLCPAWFPEKQEQ